MLSRLFGQRTNKSKRSSTRKPLLKHRRAWLEPLEVRHMLTADPRILGLSAGDSAIYEGDTFSLTASIDPNTPVTQVKFYLDDDGDGKLNTSNDVLLGTANSGSSNQWTVSGIPTGGSNDVVLGRQLFFAQATDSSSVSSNVLAFPSEVLTSDPILQPIDNDRIVAGRLFVMTAKADLPPTVTTGTVTYAYDFLEDANHTSEPSGISFDTDTGTLLWQTTTSQDSSAPYNFEITATYDDGSTQFESDPREFSLTVTPDNTAQYFTTATSSPNPLTYNNTSGPIFYSYRSDQSQGLRSDIQANIAPSADSAPSSRPLLGTLTYDTASDLLPIVEADVPVDWLNSTHFSNAATLTAQVFVSDGTSTVAQSEVVHHSKEGVSQSSGQYFHLAIPVDAASLATGRYKVTVELDYLNSSGVSVGTEDFGTDDGWKNADLRIVNRSSSDVGAGWAIAGLEQLVVQSDGVMLISGDGNAYWFDEVSSGVYDAESRTNLDLTVVSGNFRLTAPDSSYHEFDSTGRMLKYVDFLGNETVLEYYASNDNSTGAKPDALKSITDPTLHKQTFEYASGMLTTVKDFAGRATTLSYTSGLLTQIVRGPDNSTQQFAYDSNDLLISKTNTLGEVERYEYDHLMRLVRTIYPDGAYEVLQSSDVGSVAARTIVTYDSGQPVYLGSEDYPAPLIAWGVDNFGTYVASGTFMGAMGRIISSGGSVLHFTTDTSGEVSSLTQPVVGDDDAPWQEGTHVFRLRDLDTQLMELVLSATPETGETNLIYEKYVYDDDTFNLLQKWAPNSTNANEEWDYTPDTGTNTFNVVYSYTEKPVLGLTGFRVTTYDHYTNGLIETITSPDGVETTLTYTPGTVDGIPAGLIDTITSASVTTKYEYYSKDDSINDLSGSLAKSGLLKSITVGYNTSSAETTTFDYDAYATLTRVIDAGDRVMDFAYDAMGRLTTTHLRGLDGALVDGPETNYEYDAYGRLFSTTDAEGNRTINLYNLGHQLVSVVAPDPDGDGLLPGPQTIYFYNADSQIDTVIDPLGRWTQYEYDERGQLATLTQPDPDTGGITVDSPQTLYTYNDAGQVTSVEEHHATTKYEYNKYGKLMKVKAVDELGASLNSQSDGLLVSYTYNIFGQLVVETVPIDTGVLNITEYEYDSAGRIKKVYAPHPTFNGSSKGSLNIFTEYEYDADGRLWKVTAPSKDGTAAGAVTEYQYDDLGRIETIIMPTDGSSNTPTTEYDFDPDLEWVSMTDPTGNKTTWYYDVFGRIESELFEGNDPDSPGLVTIGTRSYEYDDNGRIIALEDRNGRTTEFEYDPLGRMTSEEWFDVTQTSINTLTYDYDWAGRLTGTSDPLTSTYVFEYDMLDRQKSAKVTLNDMLKSVTLASQYDEHGNREELAASIKNLSTQVVTPDFVNTYRYDDLHRVKSIKQVGQSGGNTVADKQVGLIYNDAGQLKQINRFNQTLNTTPEDPNAGLYDVSSNSDGAIAISNYTYNHAGRLTDLDSILLDTTTSSITQDWLYDRLNRVTQYTNSVDTNQVDYDYDDLNQLIEEDPGTAQNYTYDASGNRTMSGYDFGPGNRIEEDGTWTYTYDAEGNLTSRVTSSGLTETFVYDHRNRLTQIELANSTTTFFTLNYEYDTFNRRVSREKIIETDSQGGEGGPITTVTAEKFVYDGDNVVLDFYKPDGGSFALAHRYLFGPAVDQILAQENVDISASSADRVYWMLSDNLGSTRDLVDKDGSLVANSHYRYDAFGQILDGDAVLTRYLYTGREYDVDTELQYNRNRWYDPHSGRWLSEDPIGFAGGDSNLYRYVGNSPTNYTDPSGLLHATPPPGYFDDPVWGDVNRDLWNRTWSLRVHGGEGDAEPPQPPEWPPLPPILGAGMADPPFGWPPTLPPMTPSEPPPGDTVEDLQDYIEDALRRRAEDWVRDVANEYFESEIENIPEPFRDIVRRGRGPVGDQQRGVEEPGPFRELLPRDSRRRIRLTPRGVEIEIRW